MITILFTPRYCRFVSSPAPWEKEYGGKGIWRKRNMEAVFSLQSMHDRVDIHALFVLLSTPFKNIFSLLGTLILEMHVYISSERCVQVIFFPP